MNQGRLTGRLTGGKPKPQTTLTTYASLIRGVAFHPLNEGQGNQGYGWGIRLGVLPGVPSCRLLESHFLWSFGRKEYGFQTSWSRFGGVPTVLQEPYLNSTLGFA